MEEGGFTFLETILSLFIITLLFTITAPFIYKQLTQYQKDHFMTLFSSDVQFIQNLSMGNNESARMYLQKDHYVVYQTHGSAKMSRRPYPERFKISTSNLQIRYNFSGNLLDPKSIYMTFEDENFQIVFPFGKGRFYVRE